MTDFMGSFETDGKSNDYPYHKMIKDPNRLGIKTKGSALTKNISLLRSYVDVLITGRSKAAIGGNPLGNKYFLPTGIKCQSSVGEVDRHIYVNNVPDGRIPLIQTKNETSELRGLVPGMVGGMTRIDPFGLFKALVNDSSECSEIRMETIDIDNIKGYETRYVLNSEINDMSACWFPTKINTFNGESCNGGGASKSNKNKKEKEKEKKKKEKKKEKKKKKKEKKKEKKKKKKEKKKGRRRRRQGFANPNDKVGINIERVSMGYISMVLLYIFLNIVSE